MKAVTFVWSKTVDVPDSFDPTSKVDVKIAKSFAWYELSSAGGKLQKDEDLPLTKKKSKKTAVTEVSPLVSSPPESPDVVLSN